MNSNDCNWFMISSVHIVYTLLGGSHINNIILWLTGGVVGFILEGFGVCPLYNTAIYNGNHF